MPSTSSDPSKKASKYGVGLVPILVLTLLVGMIQVLSFRYIVNTEFEHALDAVTMRSP